MYEEHHPPKEEARAEEWPGQESGKVRSRNQAIAIRLSEARKKGKKVPRKVKRTAKRRKS